MPCRDYQDDWGNSQPDQQEKIDKLAAMLCFACMVLDKNEINFSRYIHKESTPLKEWWENHKDNDAKEKAEKEAFLARQYKLNRILCSLTKEELLDLSDMDIGRFVADSE